MTEALSKFVDNLDPNTIKILLILFLIILGILSVFIGITGLIPILEYNLNQGWQICCYILGGVFILFAIILFVIIITPISKKPQLKHEINITSHNHESSIKNVSNKFTLSGTYSSLPTERYLQFFVLDRNKYYLASEPGSELTKNQSWETQILLGGNDGPKIIVVALVSKDIIKICENYWKQGKTKNNWQTLDAPNSNIIECDKVIVNFTNQDLHNQRSENRLKHNQRSENPLNKIRGL